MTTDYEIAKMITGSTRAEGGVHHIESAVILGEAVEDSVDGMVRVIPYGDVFAPSGDNTATIPTSPSVKAGDTVQIGLVGGVSKRPMVVAVGGSGDRQTAETALAKRTANTAKEKAEEAEGNIAEIEETIEKFKDGTDADYAIYNYVDEEIGTVTTKITATYNTTVPNLSPFFSRSLNDIYDATDNPRGYWWNLNAKNYLTDLGDGWVRFTEASSSSARTRRFAPRKCDWVKPGEKYTLLYEFKNVTVSGTVNAYAGAGSSSYGLPQMFTAAKYQAITASTTEIRFTGTAKSDFTDCQALIQTCLSLAASASITCDMRVSLYEGEYAGPYKPHASFEYEVSSLVEQTADAIELSVSQNYVSDDEFSTTMADYYTKSDLQIDGDSITTVVQRDYAQKTYVDDAIDDISIGGTNLLIESQRAYDDGPRTNRGITIQYVGDGWWTISGTASVSTAGVISMYGHQSDSSLYLAGPGTYTVSAEFVGWSSSSATARVQASADGSIKYLTTNTPYAVFEGVTDFQYIRIHIGTSADGAVINGKFRVKLERGNMPTDWSAAPEDKAETTLVAQHSTQITQTSTSIESLALGNETYTDPDGNTVSSAIGTKVTQTQTDLTSLFQSAVTGTQTQYAVGTSSSTAPTTGWAESTPTWETGKYIWQRTAITVNNVTTYSSPVCIQGAKGETGATGATGPQGPTGPAGADGEDAAIKCTCSTAAGTAAKVATCSDSIASLEDGLAISVTFENANTSSATTLNLTANGTALGAKAIYVFGSAAASSNRFRWGAGTTIQFRYDSTLGSNAGGWVPLAVPSVMYGESSTAASTATKSATISGAVVCKGAVAAIKFSNGVTNTSNTQLTISSTGAHNIWAHGTTFASGSPYAWSAGQTVVFTFDGQHWLMNEDSLAATTSTMIRQYSQGVLVCKVGNSVGALVNANGTFDVVSVTWSNGEPTVGTALASFGTTTTIGVSGEPNVEISSTGITVNHYGTGPTASSIINSVFGNGGLTIGNNLSMRSVSGGMSSVVASIEASATNSFLELITDVAMLAIGADNQGPMTNAQLGVGADGIYYDKSARVGETPGDNLAITRYYTSSGFTVENTVYHATAEIVVMPIQFSATSNVEFAATKVATISSNYAPSESVRCVVWCSPDWSSSNFKCGYANIDSSGNITLTCPSAKYWMGQATWIRG